VTLSTERRLGAALSAAPTATRRGEFWAGARATLPLIVGAIPFAIIFGALAATAGLSPLGTMAMSAFVFAGSAQFIGVNLLAAGTSAAIIILTTFVVNLRHVLYAVTLAPYLKHLPQRWLFPLAFWLTDETFAVVITRYRRPDPSPYKHWYHLGSAVAMYSNWVACTLIGLLVGRQIADPRSWGLDFAMIVTFIGLLVPFIRTRPILVAVGVAGLSAVLTNSWPNKLGLILTALLGVAAGVWAETRRPPVAPDPAAPETAP